MALTASEKQEIIYYLGYPAKTLDSTSLDYSKILSDRLEDLPEFSENKARSLLCDIRAIEKKISESTGRFSASRVDDITINQNEWKMLQKERSRLLSLLGSNLDMPVRKRGSGMMMGVCS